MFKFRIMIQDSGNFRLIRKNKSLCGYYLWVVVCGERHDNSVVYIPEFLEFSSTHFIMKNELNGHSLEKVYEEESGNKWKI